MTATAAAEPTVTTRFGTIAYREEAVLDFPFGLPGFPGNRRFLFARVPRAEGTFQLLHGLDGDAVDLVVVPLESLGERLDPADVEAARVGLEIPAADLLVLCVVTLPAGAGAGTARVNLRAPVFVDVARRVAVQMVLPNSGYPFREPLRAA
ncbi:MAG: flagellar assembly protein FliW [Deinococcus-Thermus bacterium]|jgi:flagellar assembly factor FliW|nr:flagellar assembly protein FliW [Deinococcota bacterium]